MKAFYKTWCRLTGMLLLLSCINGFDATAQNSVVIGGNTPDPNAVLLLIGNGNQGLVIPITSDPASMQKIQGMIVFNKSDNKVYYCDGSTWKAATGGGSSTTQTLSISGNTLSITDGNNVTIASAAPTQQGQILMWDGSKWTSSSTTAPTTTGQVLKWNNTTKSWEAGTDAGGTSYTAGTGISITGSTIANTGVTSVSASTPLSVTSATTTPSISIAQSNNTTDGYLSKTDWGIFNSKLGLASTPAAGDITGSYNAGLQISAGAIVNADVSSTAAIAGIKISPDFGNQNITTTGKTVFNAVSYSWPGTQGTANTFLKNDGSGNITWAAVTGGGSVTSVSGTSPITITNPTTTPGISISPANATTDGYLVKADWSTFNGKLDATSSPAAGDIAGSYNAGLQITAGTIVNADINSTAAIAGTKINPDFGTQNITTTGKTVLNTVSYAWPGTQGGANTFLKNDGSGNITWAAGGTVTSLSGTSPITITNPTTTPGISISPANATTDGYLVKADWSTFNGKLDATSSPAVGDIAGSYNAGLQITAGTIVNADINSTAAIAGTKISPDFGTQNITTTGKTVLNTVSYAWPGTQGAASTYLKNDGAGNLTWVTSAPGGFSTDKVIPRGNGTTLVASQLYDDGTNVGVGTTSPGKKLDVSGDINIAASSGIYINNLRFMSNGGFSNTFIGEEAGINSSLAASDAISNLFVGWQSGKANTKGQYNTFLSPGAGSSNTIGNYNVYIGNDAGAGMVDGSLNTFVGFDAGRFSAHIISSTFFGNKAGRNTTGSFNTYIGERAGELATSGSENTYVGREVGDHNFTGNKITLIGSQTDVTADAFSNATAIGYGAIVGESDALVLGKNGTRVGIGISAPAYLLDVAGDGHFTGNVYAANVASPSDIRWKENVVTLDHSLQKVMNLRGVSYFWKADAKEIGIHDSLCQVGFIAQELESVFPELVTTDTKGYKAVKYANVTAVLVEAVKEQQSQIEALKKTIEALEAKLRLYESKENDELAIIRAELKKLNDLVGVEARAEKK